MKQRNIKRLISSVLGVLLCLGVFGAGTAWGELTMEQKKVLKPIVLQQLEEAVAHHNQLQRELYHEETVIKQAEEEIWNKLNNFIYLYRLKLPAKQSRWQKFKTAIFQSDPRENLVNKILKAKTEGNLDTVTKIVVSTKKLEVIVDEEINKPPYLTFEQNLRDLLPKNKTNPSFSLPAGRIAATPVTTFATLDPAQVFQPIVPILSGQPVGRTCPNRTQADFFLPAFFPPATDASAKNVRKSAWLRSDRNGGFHDDYLSEQRVQAPEEQKKPMQQLRQQQPPAQSANVVPSTQQQLPYLRQQAAAATQQTNHTDFRAYINYDDQFLTENQEKAENQEKPMQQLRQQQPPYFQQQHAAAAGQPTGNTNAEKRALLKKLRAAKAAREAAVQQPQQQLQQSYLQLPQSAQQEHFDTPILPSVDEDLENEYQAGRPRHDAPERFQVPVRLQSVPVTRIRVQPPQRSDGLNGQQQQLRQQQPPQQQQLYIRHQD